MSNVLKQEKPQWFDISLDFAIIEEIFIQNSFFAYITDHLASIHCIETVPTIRENFRQKIYQHEKYKLKHMLPALNIG